MKCKIVRRKLVAYLDGELRGRQRMLIEEHLSRCDKCKKEVDSLVKTSNFLKNWKSIESSEGFEANFWRRVSSEEKERYPLSQPILRRLTRLALPAAIAACLTAGVILGNLVEKTMSSRAVSSWEEEYVVSIGLDNFQDSPSGFLSEAYFNLASEE